MKIVLPDIVDRPMAGMTHNDRKELIGTFMPLMIAQLGDEKVAAHDNKESKAHSDPAKERHQ